MRILGLWSLVGCFLVGVIGFADAFSLDASTLKSFADGTTAGLAVVENPSLPPPGVLTYPILD